MLILFALLPGALCAPLTCANAQTDAVLQWNAIMQDTAALANPFLGFEAARGWK